MLLEIANMTLQSGDLYRKLMHEGMLEAAGMHEWQAAISEAVEKQMRIEWYPLLLKRPERANDA